MKKVSMVEAGGQGASADLFTKGGVGDAQEEKHGGNTGEEEVIHDGRIFTGRAGRGDAGGTAGRFAARITRAGIPP